MSEGTHRKGWPEFASASPLNSSNSALKGLTFLEKKILKEKLKNDLKDIETQRANVDQMLEEIHQVRAVSKERGTLVNEINKSFYSAPTPTTMEINSLKQEIVSLKNEIAARNHNVVDAGRNSSGEATGHSKFLDMMAKCSEIEEAVSAKRESLSYTAVLPPDLDEIKSYIEGRKEYLKLLEDELESKIAEQIK